MRTTCQRWIVRIGEWGFDLAVPVYEPCFKGARDSGPLQALYEYICIYIYIFPRFNQVKSIKSSQWINQVEGSQLQNSWERPLQVSDTTHVHHWCTHVFVMMTHLHLFIGPCSLCCCNVLPYVLSYNQIYNFGYQWMVIMSTQLIGFSIGGISCRFLVQPPSMIWPANLVNCALFNALQ